MTLRIAFAGSPEFAASILQRLHDAALTPVAVFTQPDKAKGRGRKVQANPVKQLAQSLEIPVLQPKRMRDPESAASLTELNVDLFIVVAYGQILPQEILDIPRLACLNVHASLLPRWRGAAPIERAAMAGDQVTGVGIMHMEAGLDTGPVYAQARCPMELGGAASFQEVEDALAQLGADQLIDVVQAFAQDRAPTPQAQSESGITYAHKLKAEDREIDWQRSAEHIQRQIWALKDRLAVRVQLDGLYMQLLQAEVVEQSPSEIPQPPGSIVDATKRGILVQCATDLLRINAVRMEKGKGSILSPGEVLNGYKAYFVAGHTFCRTDQ